MVSQSKQDTGVTMSAKPSKKERLNKLATEMQELSQDNSDPEANGSARILILRKLIAELAIETDYLAVSHRILAIEKKVEVYYA